MRRRRQIIKRYSFWVEFGAIRLLGLGVHSAAAAASFDLVNDNLGSSWLASCAFDGVAPGVWLVVHFDSVNGDLCSAVAAVGFEIQVFLLPCFSGSQSVLVIK
ncbi:hypothetical protein QVD17_19711 [Tagetes erecta]|uniref:Uncharacterized protein n=1 Tax=Tagetes erecta TaxID=13708 RepID=A0AAD8NX84_TARER|nr:hypothetical protein QVD17_19711 [Tagetes erecta]